MNNIETAIHNFLTNPNVAHALTCVPDSVANWVACDILRKLGVGEKVVAVKYLGANYPELMATIRREYPYHTA